MNVVTYQYRYLTHESVSLCDEHDSDAAAGGVRGAVQWGQHEGECDVCARLDALTTDSIERLRAEAGGAGDRRMVEVCDAAAAGDRTARLDAVRAIRSAQAME